MCTFKGSKKFQSSLILFHLPVDTEAKLCDFLVFVSLEAMSGIGLCQKCLYSYKIIIFVNNNCTSSNGIGNGKIETPHCTLLTTEMHTATIILVISGFLKNKTN